MSRLLWSLLHLVIQARTRPRCLTQSHIDLNYETDHLDTRSSSSRLYSLSRYLPPRRRPSPTVGFLPPTAVRWKFSRYVYTLPQVFPMPTRTVSFSGMNARSFIPERETKTPSLMPAQLKNGECPWPRTAKEELQPSTILTAAHTSSAETGLYMHVG